MVVNLWEQSRESSVGLKPGIIPQCQELANAQREALAIGGATEKHSGWKSSFSHAQVVYECK